MCGKSFFVYPSRLEKGQVKYCGQACYHSKDIQDHETVKSCLFCGKKYITNEGRLHNARRKYCSLKCAVKADSIRKVGEKASESKKQKISFAMRGKKHPRWKGGHTTNHGYSLIKRPEHMRADERGYVFEHVLIAEKKTGRPLSDYEVAHHADLDKTNNAPENIVVMGKAEHMRYHQNLNRLFEHWVGA
jgi:hypothetical protein